MFLSGVRFKQRDQLFGEINCPVSQGSISMTYNFDPDKWYDNEYDLLVFRRGQKKMTSVQFETAVADLEKRHQQMWLRLDNTYQIHPETD